MDSHLTTPCDIALLVQRWIDADLLLPSEGEVLLTEMAVYMASVPADAESKYPLLEALAASDWLDAKAQETLRQLLA